MQPTIDNPLSVMQKGETVICEIKRHPIGLIGAYVTSAIVIIGLIAALIFFASTLGNMFMVAGALVALFCGLIVLFAYITTKVYAANRWIITSDSVTQVAQFGLFSRQSSQLSMGNLEDITVEQNGIMTHLFNYGLLKAETAGEHSKFSFPYCPNPNYYAQQILNARELFERGNTEKSGVNVNTET